MITVRPKERCDFLINPGKGWMLMMPGAGPEEFRDWPWVSCVYYRVSWETLEPEEGRYAWDDERWEADFRRWTDAGFPVGLDTVACCNPHGGFYATPAWVREAGCRGSVYRRDSGDPMAHGKVMDRWEPDYDDPVFKEKLRNFLTAFAERYDDDPAVEFSTIRSFGAWGEWCGPRETSNRTLNWMVDVHRALFRKTQLLIPVSYHARREPVIKPALRSGIGLRRDGTGGPIAGSDQELYEIAYHRAPVILEFWGSRSYLIERGWDQLFDKEECIYGWHASRVNMGFVGQAKQWVEHEPDFLDRAAKRMGYRFRIREANYSESVKPGGAFSFGAWWRNDGVAPYTRRGALLLILRDAAGRETTIREDTTFPNRPEPIGHCRWECEVALPDTVRLGRYDLLVAMEDRFKGRTSVIRLAHEDDERGRVNLGEVEVRP